MARYDIIQESHRLTFRTSRQVYAHRLLYLLGCLGFCVLVRWASIVHPVPARDAVTGVFFGLVAPPILGVLILITLGRLVTGGVVYVLDRSRQQVYPLMT